MTPSPTVDAFRALARSSPWRWRTLRFRHRSDDEQVEAWIRRPDDLLVLTAAGRRHRITDRQDSAASVTFVATGPDDQTDPSDAFVGSRLDPLNPPLRPDGLVAERPEDWRYEFDAPMWKDYTWVAMLDPVELSHHVDVANLRIDEVAGRPAWRAELRAESGYDARCGSNCCELLWSEASWYADFGGLDQPDRDAPPIPPGTVFPDHYDVALDVQTGIVVRLRAVGARPDLGFENDIIDVDADLDDVFARGR